MNKKIYSKEISDWNKNAIFYLTEAKSPFKKILRDEMTKYFGINKNLKSILDLGAGIGDLASDLKDKYEINVTCVDFSPKMREKAILNNKKINYVIGCASKLPFKTSSFDMVIAAGVLHHLKVQEVLDDSLKEIERVLKPEGYFCYLDRSTSSLADKYEFILSSIKKIYLKIRGNHAASSTSSEVSLDRKDQNNLQKKFRFVKRNSIYSMPFKLIMVCANFLYYNFGKNIYLVFEFLTFPAAYVFERFMNFSFWETESCFILKNKK